MAITPFDRLEPKILCCTHTSPLYVLQTWSYWRWNSHTAGIQICWQAGVRCESAGWLSTFLLLWPWPWPDDLQTNLTCTTWRYIECAIWTEFPMSRLSKVIIWVDRQTDRRTDRIDQNSKPRHFAGGQKVIIILDCRTFFLCSCKQNTPGKRQDAHFST